MTEFTKGRFDYGIVVLNPMCIRNFRSVVKAQGPWPLSFELQEARDVQRDTLRLP